MVKQVKPLVILFLVLGASHAPGARGRHVVRRAMGRQHRSLRQQNQPLPDDPVHRLTSRPGT